jgi:hypothetical protein
MNSYAKLLIILLVVASNFILSSSVKTETIDRHQISSWKGIDLSQVSIGGIKYRISAREVIRKLGNPHTRKITSNCLESIDRLQYPGLVIDLDEKKYVTSIVATDPRYETDRGVKVGDSVEKAVKVYHLVAHLSSDNTVTIRDCKYGDLFLVFKSNNRHKIVTISIVFEC